MCVCVCGDVGTFIFELGTYIFLQVHLADFDRKQLWTMDVAVGGRSKRMLHFVAWFERLREALGIKEGSRVDISGVGLQSLPARLHRSRSRASRNIRELDWFVE